MPLAPEIDRLLSVVYHTTGATSEGVSVHETDRGTWLIQGLKVFKAGTFKDSMGTQRTWEPEHLQQMVFHYDLLKSRNILPNVPVRADHWSGVDGVIGYFDKLTADSEFLYADIEVTEPEAYEKWARGTYRSRSLEVGFYETNDEAVYWPVVVGLAFVDLPAVEGLHSKTSVHNKESKTMADGAGSAATTTDTTQPGGTAAGGAGAGTPDAAAQQAAAAAAAGGTGGATDTQTPPAAPVTHAAGAVHSFTVDGQTVTDFGMVQRHITALETFRKETLDSNRGDFVDALGYANKVGAPDLDATREFALSLTAEQYEKWQKSWGEINVKELLAKHGSGQKPSSDGTQPSAGATTAGSADDNIEVWSSTVKEHRRAGMPAEKIKKTDSYVRLHAVKPDHPALDGIL